MNNVGSKTLLDLQTIDARIFQAKERRAEFEPRLEEVGADAERLGSEVEAARKRLDELRADERRLEGNARDKKARLDKLDERLNAVRTVREEAAVRAETDLVRRAMETDEHEALSLLDLIRRAEERIEELEEAWSAAKEELEPKRAEILEERAGVEAEIEAMGKEREAVAAEVPSDQLAFYERIRGNSRRVVVAALTEDGACSNCWAVIPLQLQNEVRTGGVLIRCESCGVVLSDFAPSAPDPATEAPEAEEAVPEADSDAEGSASEESAEA